MSSKKQAISNFIFTKKEYIEIKKAENKNIEIIREKDGVKSPNTFSIINTLTNKKIIDKHMIEDILSFDEKKKLGRINQILKEIEIERKELDENKEISKFFEGKKQKFYANLKLPKVFKLIKEKNKISILIPNKKGVFSRDFFSVKLNNEQLKSYNRKKTDMSRIDIIRRISNGIEVKEKTAFVRGAKFTYTAQKKRVKSGDSVAVVLTYKIKDWAIKKFNFHHDVGRFQSYENPNTKKWREVAKQEAFNRMKQMLENYGVTNFRNVIESFTWTYRYSELGKFKEGVQL